MRFRQIDQIIDLVPGESITAKKTVTGGEDYLKDHFPRFAVMPGVLMLESLYQAASLLVRDCVDHKAGLIRFQAAKNVKFADFVQPGQTLEISVSIVKRNENVFTLKATGQKDGKTAVSGRLILEACDIGQSPDAAFCAQYMRQLTGQLKEAASE
ncbi:MAG TPA: beta-hydroxyacyl-ACP dehydratase [Planctomycetaceae bacterium]|nr:beta-hydroxyacyl-ACP dehydratase [Planctomycetaceae bacterium]